MSIGILLTMGANGPKRVMLCDHDERAARFAPTEGDDSLAVEFPDELHQVVEFEVGPRSAGMIGLESATQTDG